MCPAHQPYGELSLSMSLDRYGEGEESNFVIYTVYVCSCLSRVLITNTSWLDLATQIREIKEHSEQGGGRYSNVKSVNLKETLEVGRGVFPSEQVVVDRQSFWSCKQVLQSVRTIFRIW